MQNYRSPLFFSYKQIVSQNSRNRFIINSFNKESENVFFRSMKENILKKNDFFLSSDSFFSPVRYLYNKKLFYFSQLSYYLDFAKNSTKRHFFYDCRFEIKYASLLRRYKTRKLITRLANKNTFISGLNYKNYYGGAIHKLSSLEGYNFLSTLSQKYKIKKLQNTKFSQVTLLAVMFMFYKNQLRAKSLNSFIKNKKCLN